MDIYVGGGGRDVCIPDRDGLTEQITSCELDAEIREIPPGTIEDQRLIQPGGGGQFTGFGRAIAVDGDTIFAGAPSLEIDGARGAVVLYRKTSEGVVLDQTITSPNPANDTFRFARNLALDGDTLVVSGDDSLYVYTQINAVWQLQQELLDFGQDERFVSSFALDGNTLAVNVLNNIDDPTSASSSVIIFTRSNGTWTEQQEIDDQISQNSGTVAIDGNTMAIASDDPRGSIKLYTLNGDTWTQQEQFIRSNAIEDGDTGLTVALDGDILIGGANFENRQDTVYVYDLQALSNR